MKNFFPTLAKRNMDMETDSPISEPPTKVPKTVLKKYPSLYVKLHFTGSFDIQQAQSLVLSEPSMRKDGLPLLYKQMAFNLSFLAIDEDEYVMINKTIREILDLKPHTIPYLQLFVQNRDLRRVMLNRTSMLVSSFAELPPCCIGIRIRLHKPKEDYWQKHHVTALRSVVWNFILNELEPIPPHVRMFLSMELKSMATQELPTSPVTSSQSQTIAHDKPKKPQVIILA